jgi:hypothetical protein
MSYSTLFGQKMLKFMLVTLVLLAGGEFIVRGPVRAIRSESFNDLLSPYVQARAWVVGMDPYSVASLLSLWPKEAVHLESSPREIIDGSFLRQHGIPTAYPPPCFVLLTPLTLLSWPVANAVWVTLNLIFFACMVCALLSLLDLPYDKKRAYAMWVGALALAPFHTGISRANIAVLAIELSVIAVWAASRNSQIVAAILLALATCLKPQIGLCFVLYYFLGRHWRIFAVTAAVVVAITAVALTRLQVSHVVWLRDYMNDNRALLSSGALSDFTPANPIRFGLVNLQIVSYQLVRTRLGANLVAMTVVGAMFGAWLFFRLRAKGRQPQVLTLSALAVLSLLPLYHRFYDAALLILPMGWYIARYPHPKPKLLRLGPLLLVPFLLPGGSILEVLRDRGRIPRGLASAEWWNLIVMPHQVWALLALGAILLYEMANWYGDSRNSLLSIGTEIGSGSSFRKLTSKVLQKKGTGQLDVPTA